MKTAGLGAVLLVATAAPATAAPRPSGAYEIRSVETAAVGLPRPTGLAAVHGRLVVSQSRGARTVSRTLTSAGRPAQRVRAGRRSRAARRALAVVPRRLRAVAFDPSSRLAFALDGRTLRSYDRRGRRASLTLRRLGLAAPRAIAFAPSSDTTDARSVRHLFVVDRGQGTRPGRIVEVGFKTWTGPSLRAASLTAPSVETISPQFVRSIPTSTFSPSSPDPSGMAYDAANNRFIIADSEVEETPLYAGINLWTNTRGSSQGSGIGTTVGYSKEPTGISLNPADRTLYVSDDDGDRIIVDRPGLDGKYNTKDDSYYRFSTAGYGVVDPEDLVYDQSNGHLIVCDGSGLEMWDIDPVNGVFGDAGDQVSHFDLAVHGMRDCEGIGFDVDGKTLMAVDETSMKVYELTRSGALLRILDMRSIPGRNLALASIALAPTSDPTDDPSALSYWMTDRHVDNGPDPSENDGLLHEMLVPAALVPTDAPPTAAITQPAAGAQVSGVVTVSADAADDQGVVSVRFLVDGAVIGTDTNGADGWSVPWDSSRIANGSHALTAVATDSAGKTGASQPVAVAVQNAARVVSVPVRTGLDDADEVTDGTVRRTNGDLELGSDHGIATTVGLRFSNLGIPRGATIVSARVQFTADELDRAAASDVIRAEAADNAAAFTSTAFGLSSRAKTANAVSWDIPTWTVFEAAGAEQRTPELSSLVQEVVNRPGWASGNALALLITGTGRRTAESFEGEYPPVLDVQFYAP